MQIKNKAKYLLFYVGPELGEEDWDQLRPARGDTPWRLVVGRPGAHDSGAHKEGSGAAAPPPAAEMKGLQQDIALIQSRLEVTSVSTPSAS